MSIHEYPDKGRAGACVLGVGTALPPNRIEQAVIADRLRRLWGVPNDQSREWRLRFDQIYRAVQVRQRYFALQLDEYVALDSFAKANDAWLRVAPELGALAARRALAEGGVAASDVDHLFFITGTGIATPSVDALIANRLALRSELRRTPIFGLGCAGGVGGVARAAEMLRGNADAIALVIAVELCSLTLQREDSSIANVIASALFGDGAAAVVIGGANRSRMNPAPRVLATRSTFFPNTERLMGWDVVDSGLKIVLSPAIPVLIRDHLAAGVDSFLAAQGLDRAAIRHWIAHPGGNRVLEAMAAALALPPEALARSWRLLEQTGNLSSASALFVLSDLIDSDSAREGEFGLMLAMGPGFCAEMALLQW